MTDFEIRCTRCNATVEHTCRHDAKKAVMALYSWAPEGGIGDKEFQAAFTAHGRRHGWLEAEEDPNTDEVPHPFFGSQAWSYALFGDKDTARTFHALLNNVVRAAGFDPDDIKKQVYAEREKKVEQQRWATMNRECIRNIDALGLDIIRQIHAGEIVPESVWPGITEAQVKNYVRLARIRVKYADLEED